MKPVSCCCNDFVFGHHFSRKKSNGKSWQVMLAIGQQASLAFVGISAVIIIGLYIRYRKRKNARESTDAE